MLRALRASSPGLLFAATLHAQEIRPTFTPVGEVLPLTVQEAVESPNGRFLLAAAYDSVGNYALVRLDRTTGKWSRHPDIGARVGLTMSPDGRFLAFHRVQNNTRFLWVTPIDSATSLPSGPSRRVTTRPGAAPAFSPDGRTLAFRWSDTTTSWLNTVPFSGGEERVVLEQPGRFGPPHWSKDGKSLYVAYVRPAQPTFVLRVAVPGGHVDTIAGPFAPGDGPLADGRSLVGLSSDGARLLLREVVSRRAVIADAEGRALGGFTVPRGLSLSNWSRNDPLQVIGVQRRSPTLLQAVSVAEATIRPLTTGRRFDRRPTWSPDGSRLAFATLVGSRYRIVLTAPDGSDQRIIPGSGDADGPIAWSPDGRYLGYATLGQASLSVVDVRTGTERLLRIVDSTRSWAGHFIWRSDSRGVVYLREPSIPGIPTRDWEVRTVMLDGRDELSRPLPDALLPPRGRGFRFLSDSLLAVIRVDSIVVIPLPTGPRRTLYRGPILNDAIGVSRDGRWIGVVQFELGGQSNGTPWIIAVRNGEVRGLPAKLALMIDAVNFHPDGRHLLVFGRATEGRSQVVLVSLTGDPPRILTAADPSRFDFGTLAVSPDGRTVVYEDLQQLESQLVEIALPASLMHRPTVPLPAPALQRAPASRP